MPWSSRFRFGCPCSGTHRGASRPLKPASPTSLPLLLTHFFPMLSVSGCNTSLLNCPTRCIMGDLQLCLGLAAAACGSWEPLTDAWETTWAEASWTEQGEGFRRHQKENSLEYGVLRTPHYRVEYRVDGR